MSPETIIALIYLIVIIFIIIVIWIIVHKVRNKIRQVSRSLFNSDRIIDEITSRAAGKDQSAAFEEEPKSLNGMTNVCLPNIVRDFPEFNYSEVKAKNEALIKAYLNSLEAQDTSSLKTPQTATSLIRKTQYIIDDLQSQGKHIFYNDIVIYNTEISDYTKGNGLCIVKLQSAVGFINFMRDGSGNTVRGSESSKRQTVFESDYTYIQDADKLMKSGMHESFSLSCPNCGAPITNLGNKFCEYCGTGIKEININSWKFTNIEEHGIRAKQYF